MSFVDVCCGYWLPDVTGWIIRALWCLCWAWGLCIRCFRWRVLMLRRHSIHRWIGEVVDLGKTSTLHSNTRDTKDTSWFSCIIIWYLRCIVWTGTKQWTVSSVVSTSQLLDYSATQHTVNLPRWCQVVRPELTITGRCEQRELSETHDAFLLFDWPGPTRGV